jgi:hypothetical protein
MNQLNVYYRALLNYRGETTKNRDCTLDRNALTRVGTKDDRIVLKRNFCTVDTDWVEAIEEGLVFIEKAIKEERQFIRSNGEVIPIEKVRNVSKASVEHLAKHSNLITREVEGEDLIPDQLFTVEKLNDYAVYENRFLYMLLCYLRDFVTLRYNNILELSYTYDGSMTMSKTVKLPKQTLTYNVSLAEERKDDKYLMKSCEIGDIIDRIDLVLKAVLAFLSCPLMKLVAKAPMLKPPITRTNVLKMNNNFKQAMALYSFIVAYDKPGYTVETKITELAPFRAELADEMAESILMASFLTYEYGLGINAVLKEEYEEEERRRRDEEYKRRQEKLETIRRRVLTSGESPEEYIAMLEKQIRTLESKCAELDAVRAELKETKQQLADEQMRNKQLTRRLNETIEKLEALRIEFAEEVRRLNEERERAIRELTEHYENEIAALKAEHERIVTELTEHYENEIATLKAEHERIVTELTEKYETEIATLKAEHERIVTELTEKYETEIADLKTQHEEAIAALNQAHEEAIEALTADYEGRIQEMLDAHAAEMAAARELHRADVERLNGEIGTLNSTVSRLETEKQEASDAFSAEKETLEAEIERLTTEKRVANATIYQLKAEQGLENPDFTSQASFDELEHTYHAFTKFYKEQWRLTKKSIRRDLLKNKGSEDDRGEK